MYFYLNIITFCLIYFINSTIINNVNASTLLDLPISDNTKVKYYCTTGWTQLYEEELVNEGSNSSQLLTFGFWLNNSKRVSKSTFGISSRIEYLVGIPKLYTVRQKLYSFTYSLDKLNSKIDFKNDYSYTGKIKIENQYYTSNSKIIFEVKSLKRIKSKIGWVNSSKVKTTIENFDGNNNNLVFEGEYAPGLRVFISKKITMKNNKDFTPFDCKITEIKTSNNPIQANLNFIEWPNSGSILKYKCNGIIDSLKLKILKSNSKSSKVELLQDKYSVISEGENWRMYFNLSNQKEATNKKQLTKTLLNFEKPYSIKDQLPKFSYGKISILNNNSIIENGFFLIAQGYPIYYNYKSRKIQIYRFRSSQMLGGTTINTKYDYAPNLKAPVRISVISIHSGETDDIAQSFNCSLNSIN